MYLNPTLNAIEAKRRIADAQSIATAERLVRGTSRGERATAPWPRSSPRSAAPRRRRAPEARALGAIDRQPPSGAVGRPVGGYRGSPSGLSPSGGGSGGRGARRPSPRDTRRAPRATRRLARNIVGLARSDPDRLPLGHVGQGQLRARRTPRRSRASATRPSRRRGSRRAARPPPRRPSTRGPLVADPHPAAALDHEELRPVGVAVGRDPRPPRRTPSSATTPARPPSMTWPSIPVVPGGPVRAPVPDPEPANVDRHRSSSCCLCAPGWRRGSAAPSAPRRARTGSSSRAA